MVFESGEGDEDEDLDDKGFREEVGDDDEGEGEEDEAVGFNGDEHEVRERVPGDEECVVELKLFPRILGEIVTCKFVTKFHVYNKAGSSVHYIASLN
ncbi:hypothetical protein Pyn_33710 [Prunus yedoensis var. nudiflora]|uniref:Uncharacterized protein n=1 Tax=Prunus yedoensis var. nudiflora TaxID=2094558 RepID=A0A314XGR6_PRUYE|nr:hypothetical protein Pyn_33710 [Prunus yedoensis var. nudiflora]